MAFSIFIYVTVSVIRGEWGAVERFLWFLID